MSKQWFPVLLLSNLKLSSSLFAATQLKTSQIIYQRTLTVMRKCNTETTHYHYSPFLPQEEGDVDDCRTALIILNSPIHNPPSPLFKTLWNLSSFRVCADGGANRLFDATDGSDKFIPDLIRGDLDSLRSDVREYYEGNGSRIEKDPCQNTNDLDKCLQVISKEWLDKEHCDHRVCIYGAFGGRFDQEMASFQALYVWRDIFQERIFLYDDHTSAFLLSQGVVNEIRLPFYGDNQASVMDIGDGPTCGLIPIASRCDSIKTTGLKWNLDGDVALEFGGLLSTSNRIMESVVTVEASHPVVFTTEVMPGLKL